MLPDERKLELWSAGDFDDSKQGRVIRFANAIEAEVRAETREPAKFLFLACTDNGEVIPTLCANERAVFRLVMSEMFSDPTEATDEGAEHAEYVARELIAEGAVSFEGDPGLLLYKLPDGFTTRAAPQPPAPCLKCAEAERIEAIAAANLGEEIIKNGTLQAKVAELEKFQEDAFVAHPNLDLDIEALTQKGNQNVSN